VLLTAGAVVLGLGIGLSVRPRPTRFARPQIRLFALLVLGIAGELVATRLDDGAAAALGTSALVALIAFAVANLHLTGMGVMTIGLAANVLVMGVNAGMPVSARALVAADVVPAGEAGHIALRGPRHLERSSDRLTFLGDVIPVSGQVVSFGDLVIAVATVDVIAHLARRQRRSRRQPSMSSTSPVHDCGIAPSPVPSSASQYSASPDADAPRTLADATSAPARHSR
jgi:hypothetical protein